MVRVILVSLTMLALPALAQTPAESPEAPVESAPPKMPKLSPEQIKMLNSRRVKMQIPPYFFKKDGTPYTPPKVSAERQARYDMLQRKGVARAAARAVQAPLKPPVDGDLGQWLSFMHQVIHRR